LAIEAKGMKELLAKLTSYNLLNYLLPGVVFAVLAQQLTSYSFLQHEVVVAVFLYYFIGLVISRFGSLVIEPVLKKVKFLKFAEYADYVKASKTDDKIELLSEVNNSFRTYLSLFVLLLLVKLLEWMSQQFNWLLQYRAFLIIVLLLVLFLFAYRKQSGYLVQRINANERTNERN
jgi:hypothetical protein